MSISWLLARKGGNTNRFRNQYRILYISELIHSLTIESLPTAYLITYKKTGNGRAYAIRIQAAEDDIERLSDWGDYCLHPLHDNGLDHRSTDVSTRLEQRCKTNSHQMQKASRRLRYGVLRSGNHEEYYKLWHWKPARSWEAGCHGGAKSVALNFVIVDLTPLSNTSNKGARSLVVLVNEDVLCPLRRQSVYHIWVLLLSARLTRDDIPVLRRSEKHHWHARIQIFCCLEGAHLYRSAHLVKYPEQHFVQKFSRKWSCSPALAYSTKESESDGIWP